MCITYIKPQAYLLYFSLVPKTFHLKQIGSVDTVQRRVALCKV